MANQSSPLLMVTQREIKSFDFSPWGGLDGFLQASKVGGTGNNRAAQILPFVPYLARAVNMTSVAISTMHLTVMDDSGKQVDTSKDWKNKAGGMDNPRRLFKLLSASLCGGAAYALPSATDRMLVDIQYLAPHTITPRLDRNGIQAFERATDLGKAEHLEPDQLLYFWLPDPHVELGPARTHPLGTAVTSAELLLSMDRTLQTYAERGFVPATILAAKGMPAQGEREKAEAWWNKFLRGWTTTVAKIFNAEAMTVQRIGAGLEELKGGAYTDLYRQAIENIGTAFGIPAGLFMSDQAYATEMDLLTRQWYETSEFTSIYTCLEETLNDQLYERRGFRVHFNPESLPVFQTDDKTKMERYKLLTDTGVKNSVAAKVVGMDLPEGVKVEDLDPEEPVTPPAGQTDPSGKPIPQQKPAQMAKQPMTAAQTKDLKTWRDFCVRFQAKGKALPIDFECKALPDDIADAIRDKLRRAVTAEDIDKAFEVDAPVFGGVSDATARELARQIGLLALAAK